MHVCVCDGQYCATGWPFWEGGTMLGHVRIAACVIAFPENARFDVFTD